MSMQDYLGIQNKTVPDTKKILFPVFWLLLSGCVAPFGANLAVGHSREEFEHYIEEVFRFENSMTNEVMMLMDSGEISDHDPVLITEQRMHLLCKPLNEFVSRDMDGLSTGFFLRRRVMNSAMDCDHAAHEVKKLLDER